MYERRAQRRETVDGYLVRCGDSDGRPVAVNGTRRTAARVEEESDAVAMM